MRTDVVAHGKPVLFVHNPRAGGRSLEAFFNVQRLSHSYPSEVLAETHWLDSFVVTSVRHPIDRFFSSYFGNVRAPQRNSLVKKYGWGIKELNPVEFLEIIKRHPRHVGPQVQWSDFPSKTKPRADLVLRLEDVATWQTAMRDAGIEIGDREVPHKGKSKNKAKRDLSDLGLTEQAYRDLCAELEAYYSADYEAFGYELGSRI